MKKILWNICGIIFIANLLTACNNEQEGVPAGDHYSWGKYLTKAECDEWGRKGAEYGSSDRLRGVYDGSGKKRMATSYISINDKRLAEIWTCFETGYDVAYYKRY